MIDVSIRTRWGYSWVGVYRRSWCMKWMWIGWVRTKVKGLSMGKMLVWIVEWVA